MITYVSLSDEQLMTLLKQGDQLAFAQIYNRYRTQLVIHVNNMVKDQDYAQDIVQEIFTCFFNKSAILDIRTTLSSYLHSAARNRALDELRKQKTKTNYLASIAGFPICGSEITDQNVRLKELQQMVDKEINKMPDRRREIFELSRKEHLTQKEIGNRLGISENTVNTQIQRAIQALRKNKNIKIFSIVVMCCLLLFVLPPTKRLTKQPINQINNPITNKKQPTNQKTNQPTKKTTNKPICSNTLI